jgi:hypothetical protein
MLQAVLLKGGHRQQDFLWFVLLNLTPETYT